MDPSKRAQHAPKGGHNGVHNGVQKGVKKGLKRGIMGYGWTYVFKSLGLTRISTGMGSIMGSKGDPKRVVFGRVFHTISRTLPNTLKGYKGGCGDITCTEGIPKGSRRDPKRGPQMGPFLVPPYIGV